MLNARLEQFAQQDLVLGWNADERKRIESSISNLCYWLRHKLEVTETLVFGSWTRNTILPRKYDESSDIDLMVVFNGDISNRNPEQCRDRLRSFVASGYPKSDIRKDAPAVKLELNFIKYDLVPAVKDLWTKGYYIPSTSPYNSSWMYTSPKDLDPLLSNLNVRIGGNLVRNVVRLCKYMDKATCRTTMSSYQLERFLIERIQFLPYSINMRTYDIFLEVVKQISQSGTALEPRVLQNIIDWVISYKNQGDIDGQVCWMRHLLPLFSL